MHGRAIMQLGTKTIAASLVLLGGVAGAFLFRKPAATESPEPGAAIVTNQVTASSQLRIYKVSDGDTLSNLASRYLRSSDRYHEIYDLNKDILKTADVLPIGLELGIRTAFSDPSKELAD